jgi:hypothetical protein
VAGATLTKLGWQSNPASGGALAFEARYFLTPTPLSGLVAELGTKLPSRFFRFVCRKDTAVSRLAFGTHALGSAVAGLG